jgi:hypothetical protein
LWSDPGILDVYVVSLMRKKGLAHYAEPSKTSGSLWTLNGAREGQKVALGAAFERALDFNISGAVLHWMLFQNMLPGGRPCWGVRKCHRE